jgi:hypothetical protein
MVRLRTIVPVVDVLANPRSMAGLRVLLVAGSALLAVAVAVRAIPPARATLPQDVVEERPRLPEPMQLLARGSRLRAAELDRWVSEGHRAAFKASRQILFSLDGCPPLLDWIDGTEGQSTERLLADLRAGSREDALAALVLVFQIGRACKWSPGMLARTQNAERLGGLLQDWLRVWGEKGAKDPLLAQPALSAALVYGRVMRTAWKAPFFSYNRATYERASAFLSDLTGIPSGRRTDFGEALRARYARAAEKLLSPNDALLGLEEEAAVSFPDLIGTCP